MINSKASIKGVGEINLTGDKTVATIKVTAEKWKCTRLYCKYY